MFIAQAHSQWHPVLEPLRPQLERLEAFLESECAAGRPWVPGSGRVLRALETAPSDVRVVIVGQDPYPTPGHAVGLSFSVERDVRPLPRSLANIYRELRDDTGFEPPQHGDLSAWAERGVLLLNRVLSAECGRAGSHRGAGWEDITAAILSELNRRAGQGQPLVAILWGRDAQRAAPLLGNAAVIQSPHPSPLSARRGFFGSRPFTRTNKLLANAGAPPIDWVLP